MTTDETKLLFDAVDRVETLLIGYESRLRAVEEWKAGRITALAADVLSDERGDKFHDLLDKGLLERVKELEKFVVAAAPWINSMKFVVITLVVQILAIIVALVTQAITIGH
jgi:hypothetical protein